MTIFLSVIVGLAVGSFLNVCIYRLPKEKSIIVPRSFCPHCSHTIPWYDNIPVVSYILLGAKCRFCKGRISPRYIIVEVLTSAVFALLVAKFGLSATTLVYILLCCGMLVATFIDFEYQIIPDQITYGGMALGLILSFIFPELHNTPNRFRAFLFSLAGLLTGGLLIFAISKIGGVLFKEKLQKAGEKDAMGGGDITFLAMIGSFLGYKQAILIFLMAPFFGSAVGLVLKLKYKAELMPYGPYLSLATFVAIVWGEKILRILFPY